MSKKIQLSIPKPCHESWDAMTLVEKGKFCGSCQKQVVDFSNMNDRQVAEFFKKPSTGSVCGRFMTDQLERAIEIPKKRIPWFKYFFQFALPAFLFSIKGSSQKLQGKVAARPIISDTTKPMRPTMGLVAPVCRPEIKGDVEITTPYELTGSIQLKIVDDKNNVIPYASIETGVIGKGGAANKNGLFNLDKSILNISGKIFVSAGGYERKEVLVRSFSHLTGTYTVVLKEKGWLTEVVVTASTKNMVKGHVTTGYVMLIDTKQQENVLNGKVMDEKGNLIWASVQIKGTRTGMYAENGNFSFKLPGTSDSISLVASYIGYASKEVTITKKDYANVVIKLEPAQNSFLVGELIVVRKPTKKELKNVPLMKATNDPVSPVFKVFPNPVEAGTNLNIEWKQKEEGYYTLEILSGSRQSVHRQEIWIDADARLLNIDVPEVAAGNYFVVIANKKTKKTFTEKIIIQ